MSTTLKPTSRNCSLRQRCAAHDRHRPRRELRRRPAGRAGCAACARAGARPRARPRSCGHDARCAAMRPSGFSSPAAIGSMASSASSQNMSSRESATSAPSRAGAGAAASRDRAASSPCRAAAAAPRRAPRTARPPDSAPRRAAGSSPAAARSPFSSRSRSSRSPNCRSAADGVRGARALVVERNRRFRRARLILQAHVGDDPVDPRREARFAAKIGKAAMDAQEDVLRQILRARSILHRARDQREHQVLVAIDQLLKGTFDRPDGSARRARAR